MLAMLQHKIIFHPRTYGEFYQHHFESRIRKIFYQIEEDSQVAYYFPPVDEKTPLMLWILFGGNASLALDWIWMLEKVSTPGIGFLLIDYPGYGECEGKASSETILASSKKALEQWLEHFANDNPPQIGILGHSLGTGAGLLLSEKIKVRKVLLLSPFTSFADLVRKKFGSWLVPLLIHRFENIGPIKNLLKSDNPPEILIIHGTKDTVIPVEMGRELAQINPQRIKYIEIPHSNHNTILQDASLKILREFIVVN